jgi:hypothetical protein
LLVGVSTAKANSIVLNETAYSYGDGGEFNAVTTPDNFLGSYAPAAIMNGGFETFCVESTVTFYPGATYSYTLANQDSAGTALTLGAAYLYYEFGTGALSGYNYSSASSRNTDAGELQAAIWYFQGQTIPGGYPAIGTDPFVSLAESAAGGTYADATVANDTYGVDILQLVDTWGDAAQNQLVLTPPTTVPETTSTLTLLAAALTTLGFAGWKLRSK